MPAGKKKTGPKPGTQVTIDLSEIDLIERPTRTAEVKFAEDVWFTARCPSESFMWRLMQGQYVGDLIEDVFDEEDAPKVREFIKDYPAQYETKLAKYLGEVFAPEYQRLGKQVGAIVGNMAPSGDGVVSGLPDDE